MNEPKFLPADVNLFGSFPPLCDTFGKTEVECAAVYLLQGLSRNGNAWRGINWNEISGFILRDKEKVDAAALPYGNKAEPLSVLMVDLMKNPFARPDFRRLVSGGFARWIGEEGHSPLEFTEAGIERLRKWVPRKAP